MPRLQSVYNCVNVHQTFLQNLRLELNVSDCILPVICTHNGAEGEVLQSSKYINHLVGQQCDKI